jgi:hypothetical protein
LHREVERWDISAAMDQRRRRIEISIIRRLYRLERHVYPNFCCFENKSWDLLSQLEKQNKLYHRFRQAARHFRIRAGQGTTKS